MNRTRTLSGAAALAAVAVVGLSACSSSGGKPTETAAGGGGGAVANTPKMTVAMITHAAPGDTFWDQVRKGAEDAAAKDNVTLQYTADPDGAKQATLVKQAVDKKVDGIAVTLAKPDAMKSDVEAALKAGVPVVALNGGLEDWKAMGVLAYFGQDEKIAGEAAGEQLTKDGAKKTLCVIQEQGHVGLEARCAGTAEKFPATEKIYVKGTDMTNVQSTITAKLQQDKTIDRVLTLGAPFAMTALKSVSEAGSAAKVVTFDLNTEAKAAIKDGKIEWAVDQQPYVQGYMAVDSLWLNVQKGASIGGGQAVLTGPAFVTKANVDKLK
ncbi:sugar ABC transporter substrate-binding protein [Arsenicicoccus piscis]|uniref:Sugar ABC transporter substrate-binding protein n=1 Tax=Arsenicicoccus piscis TaxID=673954 RepID=A0ABQ6HUU1_9MICO|nr:sugar ABC transporter substrate-binding protein [Arsenicicoccus piscis]MCH8627466.1 sugar ABC transporter substrate-binding protein [Arsenicicoccus piscis]GMA21633.1 sugar ABC transporter substrate-binding protein [Arsenicicoccus piscis]